MRNKVHIYRTQRKSIDLVLENNKVFISGQLQIS